MRWSKGRFPRLHMSTEIIGRKNGILCRCNCRATSWRHGHFCALWPANIRMVNQMGEARIHVTGNVVLVGFDKCGTDSSIGKFLTGCVTIHDNAELGKILIFPFKMEPLLVDCLSFCHANLNDVVKASANLSCLNDSIISRLAAMFTNTELEMVKDKKERVTPRLWTKLIQSLCEPESEVLRGHFASAADLYRCNRFVF